MAASISEHQNCCKLSTYSQFGPTHYFGASTVLVSCSTPVCTGRLHGILRARRIMHASLHGALTTTRRTELPSVTNRSGTAQGCRRCLSTDLVTYWPFALPSCNGSSFIVRTGNLLPFNCKCRSMLHASMLRGALRVAFATIQSLRCILCVMIH
jgi:hypothetical protein